MQGSPPRRPTTGAGPVPGQHGAVGALPDDAAAAPRELPALPGPRVAPTASAAPPPSLLPGARAGTLRSRTPVQPDVVVFTAACPACGEDCTWSEEREDTRLRAVVSCPCPG